ncbi:MAG: hypothetical protein LBQ50_11205 [Planctomycetaceae bacterium]|nr:hypothetical protein [Planctomycetaceae bacterium]
MMHNRRLRIITSLARLKSCPTKNEIINNVCYSIENFRSKQSPEIFVNGYLPIKHKTLSRCIQKNNKRLSKKF